MRVARFVLASFLASLSTAAAGVVVIDPANGPGTDYTTITAYLLATPANGDVLLLRSGTYTGGVTSVLTLSFVADAGATVKFVNSGTGVFGGSALMMGATGSGAALVRGIEFSTPAEGGVPLWVTGQRSNSFVFVEECNVPTVGLERTRPSATAVARPSRALQFPRQHRQRDRRQHRLRHRRQAGRDREPRDASRCSAASSSAVAA